MADEGRGPGSSDFGTLLRRYRLAAGLSQDTLAERARVSSQAVSTLERGFRRAPQRETLHRLVGALALTDEQRRAFEVAATRPNSPRRRSGASVTVGPWAISETANLPFALTRFFGRAAELHDIAALCHRHRLVTLTGAGGVGKTQIALHVATALDRATVVCFVGLAPISIPSLVVTAVASALKVQEAPGRPLLQTLVAYLKDKTLLLILDNCEHVIAQTAMVAQELLVECPGVKILATSRERLMVAGERAYRLPALATNDGIALFADRAEAVDAHFTLTNENKPIIGKLCERLDGIPLAIELAAARVDMLAVPALVETLDDRFRILTGSSRSAMPRQQTMRATIDWSYNLLSAHEQRLFERLSVFASSYALAAAATICGGGQLSEGDILNSLSALVDKSLVLAELQGTAMRYRLLQSMRDYASEKLHDAGERDLIAGRHLRYLRDRFSEFWERRERTAQRGGLEAMLQTDLEDVRSALSAALQRGEVIDGSELLTRISGSWRAIGLEAEGVAWCERYLAALPASELRLRSHLLGVCSFLLGSNHKMRAFELATRGLDVARASGDASVLAKALYNYASLAVFTCQLEDAERALVEAEAIPGLSVLVRLSLLEVRASLSWFRGDLEAAVRMYEQLWKEHRSLGNVEAEQIPVLNLAEIEHARGCTPRAIAISREMLPVARAGGNKDRLAKLLFNLAGYLVAVDDVRGAAEAAREAIGIRVAREPDHAHVGIAIEHLALSLALRDNLARAAVLEGYADASLKRHRYPREHTEMLTYDRLTLLLCEAFASNELSRLIAEGAALTPDAAIALALEEDEPT